MDCLPNMDSSIDYLHIVCHYYIHHLFDIQPEHIHVVHYQNNQVYNCKLDDD